eukprot:TRINITY_DN8898_c0_g4_i2.p1 TRINITY_DN8898_c0_g4~~TRINITY_DN8898_c0_g4_i2.p1  ORF type:complete len:204 (-),score=34.37 TRINITY_DN8898_c0_g4_i2:410-1021(-)
MSTSGSPFQRQFDFDVVSELLGSTYLENGDTFQFCLKNLCFDTRIVDQKRSSSAPPRLAREEVTIGVKPQSKSIPKPPAADAKAMCETKLMSTEIEKTHQKVVTTYMLRNVPCKVTNVAMQMELKKHGLDGTYDFLHFPTRRNSSGLGYGFINFTHEDYGVRFKDIFEGYMFPWTQSEKRCCVVPADLQGLEANLKQFRDNRY